MQKSDGLFGDRKRQASHLKVGVTIFKGISNFSKIGVLTGNGKGRRLPRR